MNLQDIYQPAVIEKVKKVLEEHCKDGNRIPRIELIKALGFEVPSNSTEKTLLETIIGGIVNLKLISGYDCMPGVKGGFGVIGGTRPVTQSNFPPDFIKNLQKTLDDWFKYHARACREDIIKQMNLEPNIKNLNYISLSFKNNLVSGYNIARGMGQITKNVTRRILEDKVLETGT